MTTVRSSTWARLWLTELQRRSAGPLEDEALLRDRFDKTLGRVTALHAGRASGDEAFAGLAGHRHPLTGRPETVVRHLVADSPAALSELLDLLPPPGTGSVSLETAGTVDDDTDAALRSRGFEPYVLTLRRHTDVDTEPSGGPLDIHPVRPDEEDFVYDCLTTALSRGLDSAAPVVDLGKWARSRFCLTGDSVCLVGSLDGRPVCHGLGIPRPDRYSRRKVLYVADVFVIPEEHSRGFSRLMSSVLLRTAAEHGHRVLESDLVYGPHSARLLVGLRGAGWAEDRLQWRRTSGTVVR
jgi:GNAT superfamily N-acetyltransferase